MHRKPLSRCGGARQGGGCGIVVLGGCGSGLGRMCDFSEQYKSKVSLNKVSGMK